MKQRLDLCIKKIEQAIEKEDFDEAVRLIHQNQNEYKNEAAFLETKIRLCMLVDEYNTAIAIIKKLLQIDCKNKKAYQYLELCYQKKAVNEINNKQIKFINTENREAVQYTDDLNLYQNREKTEDFSRNETAPLITLYFLAYNNLEKYTKPAIAALLKYTSHIDLELVLIDNGSTDGTLEYFQQIEFPRKRICRVTKNIGSGFGMLAMGLAANRIERGKYVLLVANDILVTENWLDNMLKCMESDERIGLVVPMADHTTNYQTVDLQYTDFDDMQKKASVFNQSNPQKWEDRLKVIPTVMLIRQSIWAFSQMDTAFIHNFSDDDWSFQYRRMGYRLMLCGDTFVHHAGSSVVGKNPQALQENFWKGKEAFRKKYYGVDSWDDTLNFEMPMAACLVEMYKGSEEDKTLHTVLGIDVRCGSPLLQIKNDFRKMGIDVVQLSAYVQDPKYWLDLKTICEGDVFCGEMTSMVRKFSDQRFKEIILGEYLDSYSDPIIVLQEILKLLQINGYLVLKCRNLTSELSLEESLRYINNGKGHVPLFFDELINSLETAKVYSIKKISMNISADTDRLADSLVELKLSEKEDKNVQKMLQYYNADMFRKMKAESVIVIQYNGVSQ